MECIGALARYRYFAENAFFGAPAPRVFLEN